MHCWPRQMSNKTHTRSHLSTHHRSNGSILLSPRDTLTFPMATTFLSLPTCALFSLPATKTQVPSLTSLSPPSKVGFTIRKLNSSLTSFTSRGLKQLNSFAAKASMATGQEKKNEIEVFDTEEDLAESLAKYTSDLSDKFSKERGSFTVVLSGGSLVKSLRKLTEPPYIDSIDWSKWHVFWVDERVVPKDHVDSNYKLAYDGFLSRVPMPPGNVYAINDALSPEAAADDYETCLKHLVGNGTTDKSPQSGFPKFDLILMGMGPDGHVASLFPGHPLLKENQKWVAHILDSPKPPPDRISFTLPVINSSAYIALVVCGAGKADAVRTALGKSETSDVLPVQLVSPEGELKWFLDKDAASKL